jgi:cytochrome c oxidase accessory protein FixG
MLDEKSLIVTYKDWRGEPRGKGRREATLADLGLGDCIDCNACVAVCPTGIDIREGPQVGCITCALCIDACDKVMGKIGKPRGLIDYATLEDCRIEEQGGKANPLIRTIFRPRTLVYSALWAAVGVFMLLGVIDRTRLTVSAQHQRNPSYVQLSDGHVRNGFTVKIRNMEARPRNMELSIAGLPRAVIWTDSGSRATAGNVVRTTVPSDALAKLPIFVAAPGGGEERQDFIFSVRSSDGRESDSTGAVFERPN